MLDLIKGFGTKTIAAVVCVVVVILLSATVALYKSNNSKATENGALKVDNVTLQQNEAYTEASIKVTDKVVTEYVDESTKAKSASEKLRKESLNEYVKKVEPAKDGSSEQDARRAGDERVALLARRLHENYCRIRPEDNDCRTNSTDSGLPDRETTK